MQADASLDSLPSLENAGVSRETFQQLNIYFQLLKQWQAKTNLVANSTLDAYWSRHVADSLQCYQLKPLVKTWVDIGSGGGFPGLVVAIMLSNNPQTKVTLVESNQKKCAFLRAVARKTNIAIDVRAERIENFVHQNNAPEVVTARALAPLDNLLEMCWPWLSGKTIALFHKGRDYQQEIKETNDKWQFELIEHRSKTATASVILEISNLKRR